MASNEQRKLTDQELIESVVAYKEVGNQRGAAKKLGISQPQLCERLKQAQERKVYAEDGDVEALQAKPMDLPRAGKVARYIITSAQNKTRIHEGCWKNLQALAEHYEARVLVSTFKYNKDALGQRDQAKFETREQELIVEYDNDLLPFISDERIDLCPNLTFCGELNILPTAADPLSGLESYTHRKSTIVPHPKLALQSVASMPGEGVKLMYTTGCVTMRNYVKRKVGYKAEHFHNYGALLVEVDSEGHWWVRQLSQGNDGVMYDLNVRAKDGKVTIGHFAEDICFGDVHSEKADEVIAELSWGHNPNSIVEVLRPKNAHVHDLLDFGERSHHLRKDPFGVFKAHVTGKWEMTGELERTAYRVWRDISRPWMQTTVVNSNHDRHLEIFLKTMDWREDPVNAVALLRLTLFCLESITAGQEFNLLEYALGMYKPGKTNGGENPVRFLAEDASDVLLPNIDGGIEAGIHADRGANGAKGSIVGFSKLDRKMNGADKHTAAIRNHAWFCGLSASLNLGYNHGLSSWTNAHILTYVNGTRSILSIWKGKWRA